MFVLGVDEINTYIPLLIYLYLQRSCNYYRDSTKLRT